MIAFVLSGGGNRGALEVGALQALFDHGIRPDMLVGSSAGAMNAAFIATDPTPEGAKRLEEIWKEVKKEDVFPGNWFTMAWRFITGQDSLFPNDNLRRFVKAHIPPDKQRFGDLPVRLYITAANLNTCTLYLFGEDLNAFLLDAVMASAALPVSFPPLEYRGWQYVDGAVVANVPIEIAIDKGATTIYAINVGYAGEREEEIHGIVPIALRTITAIMYQHLLDDLEEAQEAPGVTLHHIHIQAFQDISSWDFSHTAEMIEEGRRITEEYLEHPVPAREVLRLARAIEPAPPPPGAVIWVPKRRRPPDR